MPPATGEVGLGVEAVVVDFKSGEALPRCVASLLAAGASRVVVVDNSTAGLSARALGAVAAGAAVEVLDSPRNGGFGAGANRGIAATTSELVLVCNPDIEMERGALAAMVAAITTPGGRAAVVAPQLLDAAGRRRPGLRPLPTLSSAAWWAMLGPLGGAGARRRWRARQAAQLAAGTPGWVPGSCLLLRRAALEQAGGFDEGFFLYLEEVELCHRLARTGWTVAEAHDALVHHSGAASTSQQGLLPLFHYHASLWRYLRRTTRGAQRLLLPAAGLAVGIRCVLSVLLSLRRAPTELLAAPARGAGASSPARRAD